MIITVYLLSVYWKKKNNKFIPVSYDMVLLLIPAGSMYIAVNEFTASQHGNSIIAPLVTFSILLCINVIVFEIYAKLAENFMLENEKTVYEQQLYMISRNTEEQKKMMGMILFVWQSIPFGKIRNLIFLPCRPERTGMQQ